MAIVKSDEVIDQVELASIQLLVELACFLYKTKRLNTGKARRLPNLSQIQYQQELSKREINLY